MLSAAFSTAVPLAGTSCAAVTNEYPRTSVFEVAEPGCEQGQQTAVVLSEHCLDRFACRPIALILRTRRASHLHQRPG